MDPITSTIIPKRKRERRPAVNIATGPEPVSIRLAQDLHDEVCQIANANRLSVSWVLKEAIRRGLPQLNLYAGIAAKPGRY
jgi:hypothetical protein